MTRGRARITHDTDALLLRRVEYGEADFIVTLFTRREGRVVALARGARKSRKRFAGALEPFFTLGIRFEERPGVDLATLVHAEVTRVRSALIADLGRMQLAGRALGWLRAALPPRTPEPHAFDRVERLLDVLNDRAHERPELELAQTGLSLLAGFGWSLDFERCVRCGKACPPDMAGLLDVVQGGLVCRACGGGRLRLDGAQRLRLARATAGAHDALTSDDSTLALTLVERVFAAHAGVESSP